MSAPDLEITPLLVLDHSYDEMLDLYRIIIGREVFVPSWSEPSVDPDDPEEPVVITHEREVVRYADVRDFVFAGDDERWFEDGKRRSDDDVAAIQKEIVKQAVESAEGLREVPEPRGLPGIGDEL